MDSAASIPVSTLRYDESLRVSWLIVWRQMVMVLLISIIVLPVVALGLTGVLTTIGVPAAAVDFVTALIPVLILPAVVQPILFMMAVNKEYRGFQIEALREDGHHEDLTLAECIPPALILWVIASVLLLILLLPIQLVASAVLAGRTLNMVVAPAIQVLFAYPVGLWLLFRLSRARFRSFRFHVARAAEPRA